MDHRFNEDTDVATFSGDEVDRILLVSNGESNFGYIENIVNPSLNSLGTSNYGNHNNKPIRNDEQGIASSHINNQLLPADSLQHVIKQREPNTNRYTTASSGEKQILPKDVFRNRFTWCCYEIFHHRLPWAFSLLCVFLGYAIIRLHIVYRNVFVSGIITGILFGCALAIPILWFCLYRFQNPKELAKIVLEMDPGLDIEQWDRISCILNDIFHLKHIWATQYFFFDGQHTLQVFRENVVKAYLKGKANHVSEIRSSKIYLQSIRETFVSGLKEDLPELVSELELPKETHKSRYLSNPAYCMIGLFMCLFQCQIIFSLLTSFLQKSFRLSSLVLIFHNLVYLVCLLRTFMRLVYPMMNILQGIKFLVIITKLAPRGSLDKWDEIARYMNQYLADAGTPCSVKFFDGNQCLEFYKKYFETLCVRNVRLEYADLIEVVKLAKPFTQPCADSC